MANFEDLGGTPEADIPDLKKKEKERKKAGFAWSAAKPGGAFSGATGGTVARAAASAAMGAGEVAAAGASGFSAFVSGLAGTALGKAFLAAGAAAFLLGAGAVGFSMLKGGGAAGGSAGGDLGALSSTVRVRAEGGDRTGYVAGKGEIAFDPVAPAPAKKEEAPAPEEAPAQQAAAPNEGLDAQRPDWRQGGLAHNLSGTKLSSNLGGDFGAKNIFSGNSAAPKLNGALSKVGILGGQKGRPVRMAPNLIGRVSQGVARPRPGANKAFGQLRVAKGLSMSGAGTSVAEGARSTAGAAFDGQTGNGNVEGGPGLPTGAVTSPSAPGGAPDMTAPSVGAPTAAVMDPSMQAINGIAAMAKQAGQLKTQGMLMMAIGVALMAIGATMVAGVFTSVIGWILIALGAMLLGMGVMMMQQSSRMKSMAESMSQSLAQRTGNINQNATNQYCIDQAYSNGTDPASCNPPDSVTQGRQFDASNSQEVQQHGEMVRDTGEVTP